MSVAPHEPEPSGPAGPAGPAGGGRPPATPIALQAIALGGAFAIYITAMVLQYACAADAGFCELARNGAVAIFVGSPAIGGLVGNLFRLPRSGGGGL